jgi:hypothetical protein
MAGRSASGRAAANTGSGVDARRAAATHMRHRGRCAWRAHLCASVHRRAADTADVRLRDTRRYRRPRCRRGGEAGRFMPAGHRLLRAGEGSVGAVHMRHPSLGGLRTANVGETLLARYAGRDAGACPSLGDGRARLRSAEAAGPIGRHPRREAGVRLPIATPIGAALIPGRACSRRFEQDAGSPDAECYQVNGAGSVGIRPRPQNAKRYQVYRPRRVGICSRS